MRVLHIDYSSQKARKTEYFLSKSENKQYKNMDEKRD